MCCEEAHVTEISEGESLRHFAVKAGDIVMADRGLATRRGIRHVVSHGGEGLVRLKKTNRVSPWLSCPCCVRWYVAKWAAGLLGSETGKV